MFKGKTRARSGVRRHMHSANRGNMSQSKPRIVQLEMMGYLGFPENLSADCRSIIFRTYTMWVVSHSCRTSQSPCTSDYL